MKRALLAAIALGSAGAGRAQQPSPAPPAGVVASSNAFALSLYRASIAPAENLLLSPISVSTAVALAYRGARGRTAEELRSVFHFPTPPDQALAAAAPLLRALAIQGENRELRVANALWVQRGMPLRPDYVADVAAQAGAGLNRVDFRDNPDAARGTINHWVAERTRDRIKDLLAPGDVSDDTRAVLVNSIWWKGGWADPFPAAATRTLPFTDWTGRSRPTPLMTAQGTYRIAEHRGVKAVEIPFHGGEVAMLVLLPQAGADLPRLEARLTPAELARWTAQLQAAPPRETVLTLPRMRLRWRQDLVPTLTTMGASTPFADDADFSGIARIPYPGEVAGAVGLSIKKVIHQTFLDMDENGAEAAAATAVVMDVVITGTAPRRSPPFVFRADHPFLFLLHDRRSGLILFMGRYVSPATG